MPPINPVPDFHRRLRREYIEPLRDTITDNSDSSDENDLMIL